MSNQFPQREKTVLDDIRLRLLAEALPGGTGKPTAKFYCPMKNVIRMDIYSNIPNAKNNGLVRADIGYDIFYTILEYIKKLTETETPNDSHYQISFDDYTFFNKKRSDAPQLIYRVIVGKDESGRIYISLLTPQTDDVKIRFFFDEPHLVTIKAIGKTPELSPQEISIRSARTWIRLMGLFMATVIPGKWVDKTPAPNGNNNGGGNGGGGYGNRNNNGGGNNGGNGGGYGGQGDGDLPF